MQQTIELDIIEHIKESYVPYAMSTIMDRALPDVRDGLKPIHRRILSAMSDKSIIYNKERSKSSEPVAETMKIHNHGDSSIYDAIALMTEQNETLLHPFIDGEGAFGKVYSKDKPSAPRYTYCRLNKFSEEMLRDYKKGILNLIGEEGEHKYPEVLSSDFPNILIKNNEGIAVGYACKFPSFNLKEICKATEEYIKNPDVDLTQFIKGADFPTGGELLFSKSELVKLCEEGKAKITLRSKYKYDEKSRIIEVYEIPYCTTADTIINEVTELIKSGKTKDILDIRDETGYNEENEREELKVSIDIKKGKDADAIMRSLFHNTSLQCNFNANMNALVDYTPTVLGVRGLIKEWLKFRKECVLKTLECNIEEKTKKLHILKGLEKVLLNIDKCVNIIRHSKEDVIIKNLINEFGIDIKQATHISELRLRKINQDYIIKQLKDIKNLEEEVEDLKNTLKNPDRINNIIINRLREISNEYGKERKTEIIYEYSNNISKEDLIEEYNCRIVYTKNYIKKHLKQSDNHKVKEGEIIIDDIATNNKSTLLVFTNKANRYKIPVYELEDLTPSAYGQFIPSLIQLEEGEEIIKIVSVDDSNKGYIVSVFENGKVAKVNIKSFMSNNKKLVNCFNTDSKLISIDYIEKDKDIFILSSEGKGLVFNTDKINSKSSRNTQGNIGIKLNEGFKVVAAIIDVTKDDRFTIHTEKGKEIFIMLDDVSSNESKNWFNHLQGRAGNQGSFLYNTRSKNDLITNVEVD
ncbi:topoisomerase IV [Clostridium perfringens]|uniref:DNA topoisomerase (ATP-hydrolyzing) n=1 Tax=Clostridium perfringens TaxID=1502 RepID=A0AAP6WQ44_CLOPF|nr:DNA topoisomerase (ATP-hydrolyzing) subunit A [Clostridium perfringens]NGU31156.1 topoisomerase IV [Clostridium perfringens]